MNCLIIDKNPVAAMRLKQLARKIADLQVSGQFTNAFEALDYLEKNAVDMVFLEIEMPEMNGLEVAKLLLNKNILVILTTSKRDYAAEAFELNVTEYLLNPLSAKRFFQAINKVRDILSRRKEQQRLADDEYMFVRDTCIVRKLKMEDILYAEAMGDYVKFYTPKKLYAIHGTLKGAEERLPKSKFIRVHRSYIVSVNKIDTMQDGGIFVNGQFLPVADAYKKPLSKRMNIFKGFQ
jgi:DNA-binding LytR/AlgR family response regulator